MNQHTFKITIYLSKENAKLSSRPSQCEQLTAVADAMNEIGYIDKTTFLIPEKYHGYQLSVTTTKIRGIPTK